MRSCTLLAAAWALCACAGDEATKTDTDTGTIADTDTGVAQLAIASGLWNGPCTIKKYKKKLGLDLKVALAEDAGVVDGVGILTVTNKGSDYSQILGLDLQGTFDGTSDLDLDVDFGQLGPYLFSGVLDGDDMVVVILPDPEVKKSSDIVFDCLLQRQ